MKKIISVILAFLIILPTFAMGVYPAENSMNNNITLTNGLWIGEAENLKFNTGAFQIVTTAPSEMSGGKALAPTYEDKTTPDVNSPADIDLSFVAPKRGTYSVWVRNTATQNSGGNSVFLSTANGEYAYCILNSGTPSDFEWSKLCSIVAKSGEAVSIRVKRRQYHHIRLDKFLITDNVLYYPEGLSGEDSDGGNSLTMEFNAPPAYPKEGAHPRLFFTAADIPRIRDNMNDPMHSVAKAHFEKMARKNFSGEFSQNDGTGNYNSTVIQTAEAKAFDYVINENEENGKKAISMAFNMLKTADFVGESIPTRNTGHLLLTCAKVYDWCYNLFESEEQKKEMISLMELHCISTVPGYPPRNGGVITSHGSESGMLVDLFSFAIAVYDERPDLFNYVAGRLYDQYVPPRNYWYQSHTYHQGSGYIGARFYWDIIAYWMMKTATGAEMFNTKDMHKVIYDCVYRTRADGQFFRQGDDYNEYGQRKGVLWGSYDMMYFYGAMLFNDPYLLGKFDETRTRQGYFYDGGENQGTFTSVLFLVLNDPDRITKSVSVFDKTKYFKSPSGMMIARTGWDMNPANPSEVDDAMALMNIGELHGGNHDHLDVGSFQLYYKGILASDSGWYGDGYGTPHDTTYLKGSIAHNVIDVYNPAIESDHGQRRPNGGGEAIDFNVWLNAGYETGTVLGHEYGPNITNPQYSYIKGDIAKAYESDYVTECTRSMLFMPLEDENYPAALVVFDRVTSPSTSLQKTWLLHMQQEPQVDAAAKRITVKNTKDNYNGKMDVQTLLPKNVDYEVIGGKGKEFVVNGINYSIDDAHYPLLDKHPAEVGWGRVEISPASEGVTDYFLNVMTVSDADSTAAPIESSLIESTTYAGVSILDRVCIFMKAIARTNSTFFITIPGTGNKKVFIDGIQKGIYELKSGSTVKYVRATEGGGVLFFESEGGKTWSVRAVSADKMIVSAYITKNGDESIVTADVEVAGTSSGKLFFAVYRGGRLVDIKRMDFYNSGSYNQSFDADVLEGAEVRLYLWDSEKTLKPITKTYYL